MNLPTLESEDIEHRMVIPARREQALLSETKDAIEDMDDPEWAPGEFY